VLVTFLAIVTTVYGVIEDDQCHLFTTCSECISDSNCGYCRYDAGCHKRDFHCQNSDLVTDQCPSFFSPELGIGTACIFLGGILTSGGGVGGGGVYIPVLVLILGLSPHVAVPISKITIFGVAVGGFIILHRKRHPKADRPLIDFDMAFMMEPMTLLGTILGVYFNIIFPTYLLIVFLVVVLGYNAYKTLTKGITLYQQETKDQKAKPIIDASGLNVSGSSINSSVSLVGENAPLIDKMSLNSRDRALKDIHDEERKIPVWQMLILGTMEIGMLALLLLKGGSSGQSVIGIECGTWQYWLLVAAAAPYLIIVTGFAGRYLRRKHQRKVASGFTYLKEDVQWTFKRTVVLPFLFIVAGVAAGFLGIGAGLVVGPIFLEMGLVPQVAVATSSYMILYTAFSTASQFLILGRLPWQLAIWYFCVGVISAMIGQAGLAEIIRRYKKQAFINFLLGGVIAVSVIAMGILEGLSVSYNLNHNVPMKFQGVCGNIA